MHTLRYFLVTLFCAVLMLPVQAKERIRVACVGNSVTYGYGLRDREDTCYPHVLQQMLGDGYDVRNFGHSGSTLLHNGHRPYIKTDEYREAINFAAEKVVIHLGLNDTDPRNWPNYSEDFIPDYRALIDSFRTANPKAQIWICLMTPISHRHHRFQSGTRDWHAAIQKDIRRIAATAGVGLIDLNMPFYSRPELFPDGLHPNAEGAGILAKTVYEAITGNHGGLKLPEIYTDGMVLQRGAAIKLHGTADAGEQVTIVFDGKRQVTHADNGGNWQVSFSGMKAGGPYKLSFSTRKRNISFSKVYIGEVWLCSGQSNMEFPLKSISTANEDLGDADSQTNLHICNLSTLYPTDAVEWSEAVLDSVNHLRLLRKAQWQQCSRETVGDFSAIAYHFGRLLADSLKIPVGIICNAVGGTTTESWIDRWTLEWQFPQILYDWTKGDFGQAWARGRALQNIRQSQNPLQRHPYEPCYMFEAGINVLEHYDIKGVAWYQGESNAHNIELHERLFKLLVESWREYFNDANLPFVFVQLSSLNRPSWPSFRNSQRLLAKEIPHVEMVVSHDVGNETDVHPRNKRPVGERLAWKALREVYLHHNVPTQPEVIDARLTGKEVLVSFRNADALQCNDETLECFEVAGEDGVFHKANAKIDGNTVRLKCPGVVKPVEVRYAWRPFTLANLHNSDGWPVSTFRIGVN